MNELIIGALILGGMYLWSQSGTAGGPGTMNLGPGGAPPRQVPGPAAGGGRAGGGAAGAALLVPITKVGQDLFRRSTGQPPPIPPRTDAGIGLTPITDLPTMYLDVPLYLYTEQQIAALATQAGTTPAHLMDAAASMGASPADAAAVMQGAADAVESGVTAVEGIGSQAGAFVGWALPVAVAAAIGGMIISSVVSQNVQDSFNRARDRARQGMAKIGRVKAYQIANAVIDSLLETNTLPNWYGVLQTSLGFDNPLWALDWDAMHDVFGDDAENRAFRAKVEEWGRRTAAVIAWFEQFKAQFGQAMQSWGSRASDVDLLTRLYQIVPPAAWWLRWAEVSRLQALGAAGMVRLLQIAVTNGLQWSDIWTTYTPEALVRGTAVATPAWEAR